MIEVWDRHPPQRRRDWLVNSQTDRLYVLQVAASAVCWDPTPVKHTEPERLSCCLTPCQRPVRFLNIHITGESLMWAAAQWVTMGVYIPCLHGNLFKRRGGHNCCQISSDSSVVATISTSALCHIKGNGGNLQPKTKTQTAFTSSLFSPLLRPAALASPPVTPASLLGRLAELKLLLCECVCSQAFIIPISGVNPWSLPGVVVDKKHSAIVIPGFLPARGQRQLRALSPLTAADPRHSVGMVRGLKPSALLFIPPKKSLFTALQQTRPRRTCRRKEWRRKYKTFLRGCPQKTSRWRYIHVSSCYPP